MSDTTHLSQIIELLREDGPPLQASCTIGRHSVDCVVEGSSYVIPISQSLPRALENLRCNLESRFKTKLYFHHCLHCIQYSSSGMALQMAQGRVGTCAIHIASVKPLFYCSDYFCYADFCPNYLPVIVPPDPINLMEHFTDFQGAARDVLAYRHGTIVLGKSNSEVSKGLCNTIVRTATRHPKPIRIFINTDGIRLVDFGMHKAFTIVSPPDLARWQEINANTTSEQVISNPRVKSQLGLDQLGEGDCDSAVLAGVRLWQDAHELETVNSTK